MKLKNLDLAIRFFNAKELQEAINLGVIDNVVDNYNFLKQEFEEELENVS